VTSMRGRKWYVGGVIGLLLLCLFMGRNLDPPKERIHQHRSYNTQVEDNNLSILADTFSTHLPIVSLDTGGQTIPGRPGKGQSASLLGKAYASGKVKIIAGTEGLNTLSDEAAVASAMRIRVRGNSSRHFDKVGYLMKLVDKNGNNKGQEVLGMEKSATWVLHGPYLDKTLMRNYMWYNLTGEIMEWAPDVRFCEVFLNGEYQGIYVLTEQIGQGEGRIQIEKSKKNAPVTSYIIRSDRGSSPQENLNNFTKYTYQSEDVLDVKYPSRDMLTPELKSYIEKDFSKFEKALYSYDYDTQRWGYWNYVDVDNWVDYVVINELTQNIDAGLYSTYFYKDVAGKLKLAVWDFNNCCDNYQEEALPMASFHMPSTTWFKQLFLDEVFVNKVIERYQSLRQGILSDDELKAYIQEVQSYLGSAIDRNFEKWGYSFEPQYDPLSDEDRKIGSYEAAIEQYEARLIGHAHWLDEHIEVLKQYCHESKTKKFNH
jgi:hypothetical protein